MTNARHVIPSLRDADARVGRSQRHRNRLEEKINGFWRSADYATLIPPYTSGSFTYAVDRHLFPSSIPILIGEVLYNLHSALDYLVHQLAVLDDGKVHFDLRFPIEDTPSDPAQVGTLSATWDTATHALLGGINASHKAVIRSFQPFEGCAWTRTLRDLRQRRFTWAALDYRGGGIDRNRRKRDWYRAGAGIPVEYAGRHAGGIGPSDVLR